MIKVLICGCNSSQTITKIRLALDGIPNLDIIFLKTESIVSENEQACMNMEIVLEPYLKLITEGSRVLPMHESVIRQFTESLDKNRKDVFPKVKKRISIPAQCRRAARLQTTWMRRK